jgi:hypothetical protein
MIWTLLLAHFLGDFPLQPDWMVRRKRELGMLALHAGVHFVLMILLVGKIRSFIWPHILVLSGFHLIQDCSKIVLTDRWPQQRVFLFFLDQLLHFAAIWGLFAWISASFPNIDTVAKPLWAIIGIAYLVSTYAWYISERVIHMDDSSFLQNIEATKFPRILVRSGLVSLFWLVRAWDGAGLALAILSPYPATEFRKRAILSDFGVSLAVILFLFLTLGTS